MIFHIRTPGQEIPSGSVRWHLDPAGLDPTLATGTERWITIEEADSALRRSYLPSEPDCIILSLEPLDSSRVPFQNNYGRITDERINKCIHPI
jgi:hypothetical protein